MEVTESYRVLELEIGASRAAVDAAYCRLVERWHPDRAAAGGPEAINEAQRMVQTINEAYQTLARTSPHSIKPLAPEPQNAALKKPVPTPTPVPPPPLSVPPAPVVKSKPRLPPLVGGQPSLGRSTPPPPPPSSTWAARPASASRASPAPGLPPPPAPPVASAPPPTKPLPPTLPPLTPPSVASTPHSAPTTAPVKLAPEIPAAPVPPPSSPRKVPGLYDMLFPLNSPLRRFAPGILAAALIVLFLFGKCALSSSSKSSSAAAKSAPDPKTTGRLVVKSNRANATVEARRLASASDATTATADGNVDQLLSGLPPGRYAVTARAEGWPEIHTEANVEMEHTTEVAMNFKSGSLRLDSDPSGATVRLGSAILGRTPLVVPQLPPGECQLSVEYPTWPAVPFKTTIAENEEATGLVRLPHGKLIVETTLPGAAVLLAGRPLGQTPLMVDRFPAGIRKLTLQAKDFPAQEISVTMEDRGEVKIHPVLGAAFPVLDPAVLLRAVWTRDDPDRVAPPLEGVTGPFQSRNGIVKNLNRKWLFETWMRKRYRFTGTIKSYDPANGQIEFTEQQSELSKHRMLAILSAEARNDPEVIAQLGKGATFAFYGRLTAVEEPRWPSKVISFELSSAEPLR